MPFQPINFAGIAPQGFDAMATLADSLKSGFDVGAAPSELRSQQALRDAQMREALATEAKSKAEAQKTQQIADLLSTYLKNRQQGGTHVEASSQVMGTGAPSSDEASDLGQALFNKMIIGETETPQQKADRSVKTALQTAVLKSQETPAKQTQGRYEKMVSTGEPMYQGIEQLLGMNRFSPGFSKRASSLGENFATAKQFPQTEESTQTAASILTPKTGISGIETHSQYKSRVINELRLLAPEMARAYKAKGEKIPGIIQKYLYTVNDPEVKLTAKKYNLTPQQVLDRLVGLS